MIYRLLACLLSYASACLTLGAADDGVWVRQVRPLLDVHCVKCHGPLETKGGLALDTLTSVLQGGTDGVVVHPGRPEESPLFTALAPEADPHMPPKKQLTDPERTLIREWIATLPPEPQPPPIPAKEAPRAFTSVTAAIDHYITAGWTARGLKAAPSVDERTWVRRLFLDLAGRLPTRSEMDDFLFAPATLTPAAKRSALVDRLLASPDYAVHMRELWDVFLMTRGKRENVSERREKNGWYKFLEEAFRSNRPWNETVRDLLTGRASEPERAGASWFLSERRNDHQLIAEAVAPVIYGATIDCAQCHDHPLAREIKQAHYWGLVAAFNRSKNVDGSPLVAESAVGGFVNFTNLKKESQPALVMLLTGRTLEEVRPKEGEKEPDPDENYLDAKAKVRVPKASRREAFAQAATEGNPLLGRAFVNRMWAALLGRGIIHPANEMTARHSPSHPELLDWLGEDFATHHYDVRRLLRGIVLSRVYALAAGTEAAERTPEAFSSALERPLTGEQLARSWRVALSLPPADPDLLRATITALPDVQPKDYTASFQQAQFLTSHPKLAALLQPTAGHVIERLATLPEPAQRVREAFLAVYARVPDAEESTAAEAFLQAQSAHPPEALRDLLWALMTSAEFLTAPR
jgi:Protein of unknown function (DUF1549)/Protein of unknown function (DUF1553)/Planctomycete cytochrome C